MRSSSRALILRCAAAIARVSCAFGKRYARCHARAPLPRPTRTLGRDRVRSPQDVTVKGDDRTRPGLFDKVLAPIYRASSLDELRVRCLEANAILNSYDIFDKVDILCDAGPEGAAPDSASVVVEVREKNKLNVKGGAYVSQSGEGSAEFSAGLNNAFGFAEKLDVEVLQGHERSSTYGFAWAQPRVFGADADVTARAYQQVSCSKRLSSFDETARGVSVTAVGGGPARLEHQLVFREIADPTRLASKAIRHQLGHSLKSSLAYSYVADTRDAPTRTRALGVRTVGDAQVVFVDAPGIVGREHYRNAAHARKVEDATALASECDALVFVVDAARQLERRDLRVLEAVRKTRAALGEMRAPPEAVLVLNKVDKIPKERRAGLTKMVDDFRAAGDFEFARVFPVSALTGAGTRALMDHIVAGAREAPWEFDATSTSDMTPAQRALEIVRESVYDGVHEDLPYGIDIAHVSWEDFRNGDARIEQNILVDTASQRKIVVGKSGEVVGRIGINARAMLERALNRKVHLILNVRLKKKKKNYRSDDVVFAEQY